MNNLNLLLLAIYFICVIYVLYQAIESLDDKFTVQLNFNALKEEIQSNNLQDFIGIRFNFERRYKLDELKRLAISIENKSDQYSVYVDWDNSSITDLSGRSRRMVRLTPGMMIDLSQPQIFSLIAPQQTLKELLTAEDVLKRKSEAGALDIAGLLIDIPRLERGAPLDRKRYAEFIDLKTALFFSLRLALRWSELGPFDRPFDRAAPRDAVALPPDYRVYVNCQFEIKKLPWTDALPWNQAKRPTGS